MRGDIEAGAVNTPQLGQVAVTVSDVQAALRFYREVIGLTFLFSPSPNLAFVSDGNVRIMLTTPEGAGAVGSNSILYFKVRDLEATHKSMVAKGGVNAREPQLTARLPDHELWIAFLKDPDGNLVGLMEEKRPAEC